MATPAIEIPGIRPRLRGLRALLDVGNGFTPYFLVLPTVLVFLTVVVYPILNAFWFSSLNGPPGPSAAFVGWSNYVRLLASSDFHSAISTTLIFTMISVTLETIFGLGIALLLNDTFPGRSLVQASILVPFAFPTVISAQMWLLMYNDRIGIISYILQQMHVLEPGATVVQTDSGIITAAIIADVWKTTPFMVIVLLAGLQVIPTEMYEAASVDGATRFQQFWTITLPMLNKPLTTALLFRTLASLGVFDLFYVLGGNQVQSMALYAYNSMFARTILDFAPGVAAAVILFLIVVGQIAYRFSAMIIVTKAALRLKSTYKLEK